jgi:hypothetical protein
VQEQQVREPGRGNTKVSVRKAAEAFRAPCLRQVYALCHDGKWRCKVDIGTSRADDGVNRPMHAITGYDPILGDLLDRSADGTSILLGQSLQVSRSWSESPAMRREVGNDVVQELGFRLDALRHEFLEVSYRLFRFSGTIQLGLVPPP